MDRLRRMIDLTLGSLCCGLVLILVAVLVWQVVSRYALNAPSSVTEEILRYGVIWMSLLGAAYATGRGGHMSVDMLRDRLSPRGRLLLDAVVALAFMAFAGIVLIWGGMKGVTIAASQTSAVMRIPMSWVYLALPVSGAVMILYAALNLADLARGRSRHADAQTQAELMGE